MIVIVKLERDSNLGKPFILDFTTSTLSSNMRDGDIGTRSDAGELCVGVTDLWAAAGLLILTLCCCTGFASHP